MELITVLVAVITLAVAILTVITGFILYINWKASREYEKEIEKAREAAEKIERRSKEVKGEFADYIRLSPKFAKMSSRLSLSLQYSQLMRTARKTEPVDALTPYVREAIDGILSTIREVEGAKLKYGKEEFDEFRREIQDIAQNLEIVDGNLPGRVQDVTEKCHEIIRLIQRFSFD